MIAAALPIALLVGLVAELVSGLLTRVLAGERPWWGRVSAIGSEARRLWSDRKGDERVTVVEVGGAAAALLGAGLAAAGALGIGPGDLVLLYLFLALAGAGTLLMRSPSNEPPAGLVAPAVQRGVAEAAFVVALGAMFLRFGALELEAVRGTQLVLGSGILLGPTMAAAGLIAAILALLISTASRLPSVPGVATKRGAPAAGTTLLLRLCRWSLAGGTALVAGVFLGGGGIEPFDIQALIPIAVATLGAAVVLGLIDALIARMPRVWRPAVSVGALVLAVAGAVAVVVA